MHFSKPLMRRPWLRGILFALAVLCGFADVAPSGAQPLANATFVINLRDAEIAILAEQVSEITGRTLVLDPALGGDVTVISAEPLDAEGVWALFQSILRVRGFVAVQAGAIWEVVPEVQARTKSAQAGQPQTGSQDFVTQLLPLARLPAAEAVRVLRPLIDENGYIEAVNDPNAVVITDTQANVDRIVNIARTFDGDKGIRAEVIRFNFAEAATVGRAIVDVLGEAGTGARISVDPASNLLLVRGSLEDIDQIRSLAIAMDIAPRANPRAVLRTAIYRLSYGDAEVVAEIIRNTLQGGTDITNPVAAAVGQAPADPAADPDSPAQEGFRSIDQLAPAAPATEVSVQASTETNSVIVRGTERQIAEVGALVKALDVQRAQVMIEAAIVEVSGEVAERLGIQLGFGDGTPPGGIAATSFGNAGNSLQSVLIALGTPTAGVLSTGLSIGAANNDFGALIQALSQSTSANLLSTPSITTMDNKPATIVVGQNVPFRTGSFATDGNTVTPFTTIERRDVGITMEVLPRVTAGGIVRLEIAQEISSLVNANVQGAADLITNRRVINTTVEAMNGGTVVLGGLITDDQQTTKGKVPGLGDLPVVGNLFKSRSNDQTRRTLFVFMRPTIMTSQHQINRTAGQKYQKLRAAEATQPPERILKDRKVRKLPLEINGLY